MPGTDGRKMSKSYGNAVLPEGPAGGRAREDPADGDRPRAQAAHRSRQPGHLPGLRPAQGLLAEGDAGVGGRRAAARRASAASTARAGCSITCWSAWRGSTPAGPSSRRARTRCGTSSTSRLAARARSGPCDDGRGACGDEDRVSHPMSDEHDRAGSATDARPATDEPAAPPAPSRRGEGRPARAAAGDGVDASPRTRPGSRSPSSRARSTSCSTSSAATRSTSTTSPSRPSRARTWNTWP